MCPDLPSELNPLKEEQEQVPYSPTYEEDQGPLKPKEGSDPAEQIDFVNSHDLREPNIPPIGEDDSPTGGVDRRGQAGDQGDDDVRGFSEGERSASSE